jgi:large subunit ribosomal protein L3
MLTSIIGTKVGMTQVFDEAGHVFPVTVVQAGPCTITALRTKEKDGYAAVQLGFGAIKEKSVTKPHAGQYKKHNLTPQKYMREFRITDPSGLSVGQEIKADIFKAGDFVDVTGVTKGKGFAGVVKRHGFAGGPVSHGQSDRLRAPGSIGAQGFQRVLPGLRMAGHMGQEYVTIQRLKIISVDADKNVLLIHGAMPGAVKGVLLISRTVKRVKAAVVAAGKGDKKKSAPSKAGKK